MSIINNPLMWSTHWNYPQGGLGRGAVQQHGWKRGGNVRGLGMTYPRYSPLHWRTKTDYAPHGLGMIFPHNQRWMTSRNPWSLALKNTVSTGVSFNTPSNAIANTQRWARAGFRGFGPTMTFPGGAGMDGHSHGMGDCGCGCGGHGSCGHGGGFDMGSLICLAALGAAAYWMGQRGAM